MAPLSAALVQSAMSLALTRYAVSGMGMGMVVVVEVDLSARSGRFGYRRTEASNAI